MNFDSEDKKPLILPTPNPPPKIELPIVNILFKILIVQKFFEAFEFVYPYSNVKVEDETKKFTVNSFYEF